MAEEVVKIQADQQPVVETSKGVSTTEFWHTMLVTAAGLAMIVYGMATSKDNMVEYGALLAGATGVVYPATRALVKRATASA